MSAVVWPRHQLPALSPLPLAAALAASLAPARPDPRPALAAELRAGYAADTVVLCGSGTQALRLGLDAALGAAAGPRRVALPAYSCFDVAAAAVAADAELLLYDLDPATLGPDDRSLDRALAAGARVVVAAPLFGLPLEWRSLEQRCEAAGAVLVEDAAQGFGAAWQGRPLGSLGAVSVLSFGRGKGWTGGRGGALLLRGSAATLPSAPPRAARLSQEMTTVAAAATQAALGRPSLYWMPVSIPWLRLGETVYREVGEVSGLPRAAAALLRRTRGLAEREAAHRRAAAAALLAGVRVRRGVAAPGPVDGAEPGFLRCPLRLARGLAGFADLRTALRLGMMPGYPAALDELPAVRARLRPDGARAWAGAAELARTLVTLPTHSALRAAEREQVLRAVDGYRA